MAPAPLKDAVGAARRGVISLPDHGPEVGSWLRRLAIAAAGLSFLVGCGSSREDRSTAGATVVRSTTADQKKTVPVSRVSHPRARVHRGRPRAAEDPGAPLTPGSTTSFAA